MSSILYKKLSLDDVIFLQERVTLSFLQIGRVGGDNTHPIPEISILELKVEFLLSLPTSRLPPLLRVQIFRSPNETVQIFTRTPSSWQVLNLRLPNIWFFFITTHSLYSLRISEFHNVKSSAEYGSHFLIRPFFQGNCHLSPDRLGNS